MNQFSVFVCTLALFGAASAGLWSRGFDPELVERPSEEYEAEYQRHLATRQEKECSAEDLKGCNPVAGWDLVTPQAKPLKCSPIGKQETKAQFWIPNPAKPCCKYHGCVVADCAALRKEWRYDTSKKCTVDDKEGSAEDKCKHRVEKKTCGCKVQECEIKACSKVKCPECEILSNVTDQCNCATNCVPRPPPRDTETCSATTKCPKCHTCENTKKIFGEKCAKKHKEHNVSPCVELQCPPSKECSPCQTPKAVSNADGCCKRITCEDIPAPANCKKPDAKTGKCANECEEPVNVPYTTVAGCNKTAKCCQKKKCETKPAAECGECHTPELKKDVCGCQEEVCKLDPVIDMCKTPVDYKVSLKTGGADTKAFSAFPKLTKTDKASIPKTNAEVTVKVTGACTPEQQTVPGTKKKECIVKFAAGKLNDPKKRIVAEISKKCTNLGHIETVEVEQDTDDLWFVEEVVIETPKDPKNPKEKVTTKVPVNKFVGKLNPQHGNWGKAGPWKPTEEVVVNKPFTCEKKCTEVMVDKHINCPPLNNGTCEPKACPEPKPCGECDVVVVKKDDCNCAGRKCIETFPEDHKCPKGEKLKLIAAAPCQKKHVCVPVTPPCKESPKPKCTQCEESVISQAPVFVDEEGKEGKVTFCDKWACEKRDQCMTKEEAQEKLHCHSPCEEPVESEETMKCGCKKWECAPRNVDKCSEQCGDCQVCKKVLSLQCERHMFECVKECKPEEKCQVPKLLNGENVMDKCECPIFESKPCLNDPVNACEMGKNNIERGKDGCGCDASVLVPCKQTEKPVCNDTCHELKKEVDGCCTSYTCPKKPCPEVKDIECAKCERVVVHEDECKCCKSTCEPMKCPPIKRCPLGQKPTYVTGECDCAILVSCTPEGGEVKTCPKDKKCKNPNKVVELCDECVKK